MAPLAPPPIAPPMTNMIVRWREVDRLLGHRRKSEDWIATQKCLELTVITAGVQHSLELSPKHDCSDMLFCYIWDFLSFYLHRSLIFFCLVCF